jgi:hypothetical protein
MRGEIPSAVAEPTTIRTPLGCRGSPGLRAGAPHFLAFFSVHADALNRISRAHTFVRVRLYDNLVS